MLSWIKAWRNKGYKNIYGTSTIQEWCSRFTRNRDSVRVLDIGCGDGRDLLAIRRNLDEGCTAELFGIECTEELARQAAKHGVSTSRVDLEAESLPFPDNYFDIVTANQVMEHLKNSIWAFHEQVRVTKRGGLVIVGVPNLAALHNRILVAMGRQPSCIKADGPHVRGFTLHELRRIANSAQGIEVIRSGGTYVYGFPPSIGRFLGHLFPSLSATVLLGIRKTAETADILSILGPAARFETNFFLGPSENVREGRLSLPKEKSA